MYVSIHYSFKRKKKILICFVTFRMYNPSRGGVRGGADQFTWESVKTDKHRENYLGI